MSTILLVAAATLRVAIPSFEVERAPAPLTTRLPQDYAEALESLKCAEGVPLPAALPETEKAVAECEGNSACVAGVGFRAGFDFVLLGHMEKLDDRFETRFKLVNTHDFASRKTFGGHFSGTLLDLPQGIKDLAPVICHELNPTWTDPSRKTPESEAADLGFDDGATQPPEPVPAPQVADSGMDRCARKLEAKQKDKAMSLFREGKKLMDASQTEQALALFEEAHCDYPAPALRRATSEAQLKLGWCDEAGVSAQLWRDESSGNERTAADAWLAQLRTACASVDVNVVPDGAAFSVDGDRRPLADSHWAGKLLVGVHILAAEKPGFKRQEERVRVIAGSSLRLTLSLDSDTAAAVVPAAPRALAAVSPAPPPPAPPPPPPAAPPPPAQQAARAPPPPAPQPQPPAQVSAAPQPPSPALRVGESQAPAAPAGKVLWEPWVPAGVAVVGLAVAIAEGALTKQCPTTVFTPNDAYDAALCVNSHAIGADVGWAFAGAGAVTAGVLWLVLRNQPVVKDSRPVKLSVSGNGVSLSAGF